MLILLLNLRGVEVFILRIRPINVSQQGTDGFALLFFVGMHVQVERGAHIGMPKNGADGLYVALAGDKTGGEGVAETVKPNAGHSNLLAQFIEIVSVCPRL